MSIVPYETSQHDNRFEERMNAMRAANRAKYMLGLLHKHFDTEPATTVTAKRNGQLEYYRSWGGASSS
jgi:hypothetical protein